MSGSAAPRLRLRPARHPDRIPVGRRDVDPVLLLAPAHRSGGSATEPPDQWLSSFDAHLPLPLPPVSAGTGSLLDAQRARLTADGPNESHVPWYPSPWASGRVQSQTPSGKIASRSAHSAEVNTTS